MRTSPVAESSFTTVGLFLVVIVGLYVGQGIFVPLVLAVLVAFALSPVVAAFRKIGAPHLVATLAAVVAAVILIAFLGYLVVTQLLKLAVDLPQYQTTIIEKIRSFQASAGAGDTFERLATAAERLGEQTGLSKSQAGTEGNPFPVTVTNVPPSPLAGVQGLLGSMLGPLATGAIVVVLVVFLLLEREDLRDRFLKLVSRGDLRTSTKVMNESASRVSRYLFVQFLVNSIYGAVFGLGLTLIGVPNAILWGLFATLFRYIPFVGTLIAVTFPILLAFAVDPGWTMLTGVVVLYLVIELTTTNAIEPRLYGSSTGLSALAVLIAAIFWATLWGPAGLILATPLTVCLVVIGRYVPQLSFLEIMLGSDPVLSKEQRFYQRLLARNTEEAVELATADAEASSAHDFLDAVAIPALRLAEADLEIDGADLGPRRALVETMTEVLDEIAPDESGSEKQDIMTRVLAIGGKTELDAVAAEMLARMLQEKVDVHVLPPISVRREGLGQIELTGVKIVCLCYLGGNPKSFVRFAATRLKQRQPDVKVLACLFNVSNLDTEFSPTDLGVDGIAKTLRSALTFASEMAGVSTPAAAVVSPQVTRQLDSLRQLQRDTRYGGWLDEFLTEVAGSWDVPLAVATILERDVADPSREAGVLDPSRANVLAAEIAQTAAPLVIEDVSAHPRLGENPFLLENGIQFYAGVPLQASDGATLGSLSVVDTKPRSFSAEDTERLRAWARKLMDRVQMPLAP